MNTRPSHAHRRRLFLLSRLLPAAALGLALGLALGCADEPASCDTLCHDAGYDENAEEQSTMGGGLECVCGGLGVGIPEDACSSYCVSAGYDAGEASVSGDACLCGS